MMIIIIIIIIIIIRENGLNIIKQKDQGKAFKNEPTSRKYLEQLKMFSSSDY